MERLRLCIRQTVLGMFCLGLLVPACAGQTTPTPAPTLSPTRAVEAPAATTAAETPAGQGAGAVSSRVVDSPQALVGIDLLAAPGFVAACDHPPEATVTCVGPGELPAAGWQIDVDVSAATYARWRLAWDNPQLALTGNETLALDLRSTGTVRANVYVVERDGTRVYLNLAQYGMQSINAELGPRETAQTIHIPLREFQDEAGQRPNYDEITEIQIVFEWADMAGSLALDGLRFESVWQEPVVVSDQAYAWAEALEVPAGFAVDVVADGLREMTQIQFAPDGSMLVAIQGGRVWWYTDESGAESSGRDGVYDTRRLYESGFPEIVGLLYDPVDRAVWIGGRGQLMRTLDTDGNGVADQREVRIEGLPWGRHQNNGLTWNPVPDPFTGEPSFYWLYFGLGSVDDLDVGGDKNAAIVRFPRDGQDADDLEVVSRGNRNTYDLLWAPVPLESAPNGIQWSLFASENGPDFNDAPDEVNHIRWQHHYGFPEHFGRVAADETEGAPYSGPIYPVAAHASANGVAFVVKSSWPENYRTLYVSLFGEVFSPDPVGHIVERVVLTPEVMLDGETTFRGEASQFIGGLDRPLPLTVGPTGDLIVGDYATGVVYRVYYTGDPLGE